MSKPRVQSVEFRDEIYGVLCLCIPVDGDGGARELLKLFASVIEPGTYKGSDEALDKILALQALLPGESEEP